MAINQNITILDGTVYLGTRDANGEPVGLANVGVTSELKVSLSSEEKKFKDARGNLLASVKLIPEGTVSINLRDMNLDNIRRALYGTKSTVAAGNGTKTFNRALTAGEVLTLGHLNVSNVVATGLTAGTDYRVLNAAAGSIEMLAGHAAGVTFTFDHGAYVGTGLLQTGATEYFLYFEGQDLANGKPVVVELYRVKFGVAKELSLIGTDFAALTLDGDLLVDTTKATDATYGQYGSYKALS